MKANNYLLRQELTYETKLIPDTALYISNLIGKLGVNRKKSLMLCFTLEAALEERMGQLNEQNPYLVIEVRDNVPKSEIEVSITDKGVPYILTRNQRRILSRGLVDRFNFQQLGSEGQRISFFIRRDKPYTSTQPVQEPETLKDSNISVHVMTTRDEDIIEAIRCIYSVYEFNYTHQELYSIKSLRKMLLGKKYFAMLAQNEHKQTIGYIALEEHSDFPGLMEMCSLVIKPYARGQNIARKLFMSIFQEAHKMQINGILGNPVTYHTATQKLSNECNFTPCGMYFNLYAPEVVGSYADGDRRMDGVICVKIINHEKVHNLYLTDECSQFVCDILDSENVKYTLNLNHKNINYPEHSSLINYSIDSLNRSFTLTVDRIGSDFTSQIEQLKGQYENEAIELVILYLNMNDPICPECYKKFRDEGFIFSGCLPGSTSGDYVILQHLKGRPVVKGKNTLEENYRKMAETLYAINGL